MDTHHALTAIHSCVGQALRMHLGHVLMLAHLVQIQIVRVFKLAINTLHVPTVWGLRWLLRLTRQMMVLSSVATALMTHQLAARSPAQVIRQQSVQLARHATLTQLVQRCTLKPFSVVKMCGKQVPLARSLVPVANHMTAPSKQAVLHTQPVLTPSQSKASQNQMRFLSNRTIVEPHSKKHLVSVKYPAQHRWMKIAL